MLRRHIRTEPAALHVEPIWALFGVRPFRAKLILAIGQVQYAHLLACIEAVGAQVLRSNRAHLLIGSGQFVARRRRTRWISSSPCSGDHSREVPLTSSCRKTPQTADLTLLRKKQNRRYCGGF